MRKTPRISETEWEVMKVVWSHGSCSAGQIIAALQKVDVSWHPRTAKAFLNRLVKKKILGFSKEGRAYVYRPMVRQEDCVEAASESFLERVLGRTPPATVLQLVKTADLSTEDIEELRGILRAKERKS